MKKLFFILILCLGFGLQAQQLENAAQYKSAIQDAHRHITLVCDGNGVSDKSRIKELKDIYFAYLSIYNKQDLSNLSDDDASMQRLRTVYDFQNTLLDSVLGDNCYANQIANFKNELKTRCGKEYADVNKSYLKVFKKTQVPVVFSSFEEFDAYLNKYRNILSVQRSYITTIERRESIAANTTSIVTRCGKEFKEIANSYRDVLDAINMVPSQSTVEEADRFIGRLDEFLLVQQEYLKVVDRIDAIFKRNTTLLNACNKGNSDVASAFKDLVASVNFVPSFAELAGAKFFNDKMAEFETMQDIYQQIIAIRNDINTRRTAIEGNKKADKSVVAGYKLLQDRVNFTPSFSNVEKGNEFLLMLTNFQQLQQKVQDIIALDDTITLTNKSIKGHKECSNLVKAYDILMKNMATEITILNEGDMDKYIRHQEAVRTIQLRVVEVMENNKKEYDARLKKVKEIDRIKLVLELE